MLINIYGQIIRLNSITHVGINFYISCIDWFSKVTFINTKNKLISAEQESC